MTLARSVAAAQPHRHLRTAGWPCLRAIEQPRRGLGAAPPSGGGGAAGRPGLAVRVLSTSPHFDDTRQPIVFTDYTVYKVG